jgi:hypothetical protein
MSSGRDAPEFDLHGTGRWWGFPRFLADDQVNAKRSRTWTPSPGRMRRVGYQHAKSSRSDRRRSSSDSGVRDISDWRIERSIEATDLAAPEEKAPAHVRPVNAWIPVDDRNPGPTNGKRREIIAPFSSVIGSNDHSQGRALTLATRDQVRVPLPLGTPAGRPGFEA